MRCKRCHVQVPDEANQCPHCGQDLTSLRQLLQISYEEELVGLTDQALPAPKVDPLPVPGRKGESAAREEPRILLDPREDEPAPDSGVGYSIADTLSIQEDAEREERTSGWERALRGGFGLRFMAFAVDHFVVFLIFLIFVVCGLLAIELAPGRSLEISTGNLVKLILPALVPLGLMLSLAYFSFFHGAWGQTIGKMIFGLRVVRVDGQPLTFSQALMRTLSYALSALPFFLGFLWVGFTSGKRSWHDRITGTMVIREQ